MKKHCIFLFLMIVTILSSYAQKPIVSGNENDKIVYQGYLIRLIPENNVGYGYDIFSLNQMVVHQTGNPFTLSPIGLKTREDALKIAKWQVEQLRLRRNVFLVKNQPIPKDVARKLDIRWN